jgi:hypothetical protein
MQDLKQFLELFNPLPGNRYLHVTTAKNHISEVLNSMLKDLDGEFNLALYNNENLDFTKPFNAIAREHDMVILQDVFQAHQNKSMILKIAYRTLANSAYIIILEKKGLMDIGITKEMLEEHEFRAPNAIDVLEGYDLIMAKKMHMWGNGL